MKKIVYVVSNAISEEYYGVNLNNDVIFTTEKDEALFFETEEEILAYENNGFTFPADCKIDSFIVNA